VNQVITDASPLLADRFGADVMPMPAARAKDGETLPRRVAAELRLKRSGSVVRRDAEVEEAGRAPDRPDRANCLSRNTCNACGSVV